MVTELTKEQEADIIPHRDFWLNYIWSCQNQTQKDKAEKLVHWLYEFCGFQKPEVIFVDSPYAAQVKANQLNPGEKKYYDFGSYGSITDYGWVAYMDYFIKHKLITTEKEAEFNNFKELLLSGVYNMIQFSNVCIVSNMPKKINRDIENRMHSVTEKAIEFHDDWGLYFIHGRNLPEKTFKAIQEKTFTTSEFFQISNEDEKSACLAMMQELYGEEHIVNFFRENLTEVDTYVDKKEEKYLEGTTRGMNVGVYTLFKGVIDGTEVAYTRCYCPSTDRMFFLGVNPIHTEAKNAIASLYRVPKKLKKHIKYIQRQGERFSTVFDEKGTEMLRQNKLTKEEIADTVTLTGNEYFSLLKFEY